MSDTPFYRQKRPCYAGPHAPKRTRTSTQLAWTRPSTWRGKVYSVQIVQERPDRMCRVDDMDGWAIWMLPRMLPPPSVREHLVAWRHVVVIRTFAPGPTSPAKEVSRPTGAHTSPVARLGTLQPEWTRDALVSAASRQRLSVKLLCRRLVSGVDGAGVMHVVHRAHDGVISHGPIGTPCIVGAGWGERETQSKGGGGQHCEESPLQRSPGGWIDALYRGGCLLADHRHR